MKKTAVRSSVFFIMLLFCFISPSRADQPVKNTCVNCHTNDVILQTLFTPPNVQEAEGEG